MFCFKNELEILEDIIIHKARAVSQSLVQNKKQSLSIVFVSSRRPRKNFSRQNENMLFWVLERRMIDIFAIGVIIGLLFFGTIAFIWFSVPWFLISFLSKRIQSFKRKRNFTVVAWTITAYVWTVLGLIIFFRAIPPVSSPITPLNAAITFWLSPFVLVIYVPAWLFGLTLFVLRQYESISPRQVVNRIPFL